MTTAKIAPFENYASEYESWFEKNKFAYESELRAIQEQVPRAGEGLEVGVGSGRFAAPLGIRLGIDPAEKMRELARSRGVEAIEGVAEKLPFDNRRFSFVLMVTTICFLDDIESSFKEAYRVLVPGGRLIVGFIDKDSPVGKSYQQQKKESRFYRAATFYSVDEIKSFLKKSGFKNMSFSQTIFQSLHRIKKIEPVKDGHGEGSFVVVKAIRPRAG